MYRFFVQTDYEVLPIIVSVEADNQIDALKELIEKVEKQSIGTIKNIVIIKQ